MTTTTTNFVRVILLLLGIDMNIYAQQIHFSHQDSLSFEFRLFKGSGTYEGLYFEKSTGNNCASAPTLTPGAALVCANTVGDGTQAGEIAPTCTAFGGGGVTDRTTWFRFTATSTQMVLDYMRTLQTNCVTSLAVYGPFASGAGCLPTAAQSVYCESGIAAGDPGDHNLLSGLVVGQDYLIQILNKDCGGGNSREAYFCIGISNMAANNTPSTATNINACGSVFNGNNAQGYYPSGTGTSLANLDGNSGTTCSGCTAGNDVPYVVNNDSWFNFCSASAGQWQVSFNVGTCYQSSPNTGLQMSILTGTTSNLTNSQNAPNPTAPGATWNSSTITLSAGQCAFLIVDGFAGDQCTYNYTLTNISGGCVLLPVELSQFTLQRFERQVYLKWIIESEKNNDYFTVERSLDGINWNQVSEIGSIGNHTFQYEYSYMDDLGTIAPSKTLYYRLSQTDLDGNRKEIGLASSKGLMQTDDLILVTPNPIKDEKFDLSIESKVESYAMIKLMDSKGIEITSRSVSLAHGANILSFESDGLSHGVYFFQIQTKEGFQTTRFIIQ